MRRPPILTAAALGTLAGLAMVPAHASASSPPAWRHGAANAYSVGIPVPPRIQWNENFGYCGEVSFISAGLYYGQYLSQYDARAVASKGTPQYRADSQLLLGVNDTYAASQMHLRYAEWKPGGGASAASFLTWVKSQVIQGHPVAIGVYTNEYRFYGNTNPSAGDPEYDHIVPVTGITSQQPLTLPAAYHATDTLTFNDNALWSGSPTHVFSYSFGSFQATRQQANARNGNIYSLADAVPDFGIAITGVSDADHETVPVQVTTSANYETPQIRNGSNTRPNPMPLTLTATVSGLKAGETYHLYRYDSVASVPDSAFNASHSAASQEWTFTASGTTYTLNQPIESANEVIYRAVPASAP